MADIGGHSFLHNSIQKVLKYTGRIYSTRSLQIRGVFAVQVHVRRVRGASNQKLFNVTSIGKSTQIQLLSSMLKSPELEFLEHY